MSIEVAKIDRSPYGWAYRAVISCDGENCEMSMRGSTDRVSNDRAISFMESEALQRGWVRRQTPHKRRDWPKPARHYCPGCLDPRLGTQEESRT